VFIKGIRLEFMFSIDGVFNWLGEKLLLVFILGEWMDLMLRLRFSGVFKGNFVESGVAELVFRSVIFPVILTRISFFSSIEESLFNSCIPPVTTWVLLRSTLPFKGCNFFLTVICFWLIYISALCLSLDWWRVNGKLLRCGPDPTADCFMIKSILLF
jgi:hypothetical protein